MRHGIIDAFIVGGAPVVRHRSWTLDQASAPRKPTVPHHTREPQGLQGPCLHTHPCRWRWRSHHPLASCVEGGEHDAWGDWAQHIMCTNLARCD